MSAPQALRRVMLATPSYHCGMVECAGVWMPLGLAYLAGALDSAGYDAEIYDAMSLFHGDEQIQARLVRSKPDVVAVTAYTATAEAALHLLRMAKELLPGCTTVIGGVHPTFMAGEMLADPSVDFVVRGVGETTLPELLDCLGCGGDPATVLGVSFRTGSGVRHAPDGPLHTDLDALPIAWDHIDWPLYHYRTKPGSRLAITSWSRGCNQHCTFCSQRKMWRGTLRVRGVDAIIAEAKMLAGTYGVDTLEVADEYPTCDRGRWETILDRLIEEDLGIELLIETRASDVVRDADIIDKYRRAGILHVYVGLESPRQDRLDAMQKNLAVEDSKRAIELLNEADIITETSFMLGFADETPQSVAETLAQALEYDPDLAFFIALTPWPYADLYADVADRVEDHDYSRYNLTHPVMPSNAMSIAELEGAISRSFMTFYADKMRRVGQMSPAKRNYLTKVARLLMDRSYLSEEASVALGHAAMPAGHPGMAPVGHPAGVGVGGHPGTPPMGHPAAGRSGVMPVGHPGAMPAGHPVMVGQHGQD
jgi:anaerobic magnesium-protoporphyrin IX monomethyl ester cyclase